MEIEAVGDVVAKVAEEVVKNSSNIFEMIKELSPFGDAKRKGATLYIKSLEDSNLPPDAKATALWNAKKSFKELINQATIAERAQKSAKTGTNFSSESKVEPEWFSRFMDSAKHISNDDLQTLWGKVLAGEFEAPGRTPPSTIRVLSEITPTYARLFSILCSMRLLLLLSDEQGNPLSVEDVIVVPYKAESEVLQKVGLTFSALSELSSLGLIQFDPGDGYCVSLSCKQFPVIHIMYEGGAFTCTEYFDGEFPIGNVRLTEAGKCISRLITPISLDDYLDLILEYYQSQNELTISKQIPIIEKEETAKTSTGYSFHWQ